jgi:pimeloyl-ACP methyl ester carboxylesterase
VVALLGAACSSGASRSGAGAATTGGTAARATPSTAPAAQPLEQPSVRCGAPDTRATLVRFQAADGTSLDGVLVGSGTAGVVLVHEYPADLCGFWPFTDYLGRRGLRAFAIDLRCFGLSACPKATPGAGWSTTSPPPSPSCAAAASPGSRWSARPWAARRC